MPINRCLTITNDILCELAHELTVRECLGRDLRLDVASEDEVAYTAAARIIFDQIYDIVAGLLDPSSEEGQS